MKKVINKILNVIAMFAIYFLVFSSAKKVGFFSGVSIWEMPIGCVIGYYFYQLIEFAAKKLIKNKKASKDN